MLDLSLSSNPTFSPLKIVFYKNNNLFDQIIQSNSLYQYVIMFTLIMPYLIMLWEKNTDCGVVLVLATVFMMHF